MKANQSTESALWFFSPLLLPKRNVFIDVYKRRKKIYIFLINLFFCYLSRSNCLKLKSPRAVLGDEKHTLRDLRLVTPLWCRLGFNSQPSSVAHFHLGRQVLGLWLAFCIVGSDGTGDALYCEPDIAVPGQQSDW